MSPEQARDIWAFGVVLYECPRVVLKLVVLGKTQFFQPRADVFAVAPSFHLPIHMFDDSALVDVEGPPVGHATIRHQDAIGRGCLLAGIAQNWVVETE